MKLDRRQVIAGAGLTLAAGPASGARPEPRWIPFEHDASEGVKVEVVINGVTLRGIVDSGASHVFLDGPSAQRAGLKPEGPSVRVEAWENTTQTQFAAPVNVRLGDHVATVTPAVVPAGGGPPDMVLLGCNLFAGKLIEFDFQARRLRILPRKGFHAPFGFKRITAPRPSGQRERGGPPFIIPLLVDGHPAYATLDLGAAAPLIVSQPMVDRYRLLEGRRASRGMSSDLGGPFTYPVFTLPQLKLGGAVLRDLPVDTFRDPLERAVIGLDLISRFRLIIDMTTHEIWVKPQAEVLATAFPKDHAGLAAMPQEAGRDVRVVFVAPGSPAEAGGWKVGDVITAIDGQPAANLGRSWKFGPVGKSISLTPKGGQVRTLILADYY